MVSTDRDGHRVGDVGRFGELREVELQLDGDLHLVFGGPPVAGEDFLDAGRRVMGDGDSRFAGGETDDAAGVSHEDRGVRALVVGEELFERHSLGGVVGDHVSDAGVDLGQPGLDRVGRAAADDSGFAEVDRGVVEIEDRIAGGVETRVDPQDPAVAHDFRSQLVPSLRSRSEIPISASRSRIASPVA